MVCVSVMQRRPYGEMCVFALIWCKYDLRKGHSFVCSEMGQDATNVSGRFFFCAVYR